MTQFELALYSVNGTTSQAGGEGAKSRPEFCGERQKERKRKNAGGQVGQACLSWRRLRLGLYRGVLGSITERNNYICSVAQCKTTQSTLTRLQLVDATFR